MTPEDEIAEIVERTITTKLVNYELYQIPSFPEIKIKKMFNIYSVRLGFDFRYDEICIEKYENLKWTFKTKKIEFRNLILDRPRSIVFSGTGTVVTNSLHYHDCVFTSEKLMENLFCHNCVYYKEENK